MTSYRSTRLALIASLCGALSFNACFDEPALEPLCFDLSDELLNSKAKILEERDANELKRLDKQQFNELFNERQLTCVEPNPLEEPCWELYIISYAQQSLKGDIAIEMRKYPWRFAVNSVSISSEVAVCDLPEDAGDCYQDEDCGEGMSCVGLLNSRDQTSLQRRAAQRLCDGRLSCSRCLSPCPEECREEECLHVISELCATRLDQ